MRILHLIHSEGVYGAERILLYLAREQQLRGHSPVIGSMRDPHTPQTDFEALAASMRLPVVPIRIAPRPTIPVVRHLLGVVRETGAEVVHSHGYKGNILLGPLPRRLRGPMLSTLHGWVTARGVSALRLYELLDRLALRRIDQVVVVTRAMLALPALRALAPQRRRLIENGIPDLAARLEDLAARGVPPLPPALVAAVQDRPTLLAIGRLSPEKGFELLIQAFAQARASTGSRYRLVVVGEGPERDNLTRCISALGLQDDVLLAGFLEGPDRLLAQAVGFVMSSYTEGMPLVLLEALQWGAPVVATRVGAIPEILEHSRAGAVMVPPHDLPALRQALGQLMAAPGKRQAIQPEADGKRYSSGRMAEEYLSAYQAIT
ncbi:MAG: glycosyltransferase [Proteobacteria bacterium]|nr:glycosyltransferase [Pseudomonadota bacterium]